MTTTEPDIQLSYDPFSFAVFEEPYSVYRHLRNRAPVYYNEKRDVWAVSRYSDVQEALRRPEVFSSAAGDDIDETHHAYSSGNLVALDPPCHRVLRSVVGGVFQPRRLEARETMARELATRLIAGMVGEGGGDLANEFALPFAVGIGMRLLGCPPDDDPALTELFDRVMARSIGVRQLPPDAVKANEETERYFAEAVARRRREIVQAGSGPDDPDALSATAMAVEAGKIEVEEAPGLIHLLFSAAIDTVSGMITSSFVLLDRWPDLREQLAADPLLLPAAVEEVLRYEAPIQYTARLTTQAVEVQNVVIPEGVRVVLLIGSANRDERRFSNPDDFDILRSENPHLTFGDGIHRCLGAPLARLEGRVSLEVMLSLAPRYEIVGTPQRVTKHMVRGFSYLPIQIAR